MAGDKAPAFQFYPRDFMADPGVQRLSWDQRGRYVWALCCSSLTDTPGVALEADWASWMGYDAAGWAENRMAHARCFRVQGGTWTQRRLQETRASQQAFRSDASAGGRARIACMDASMRQAFAKKGAAARWRKNASDDASGMQADASSASASASASSRDSERPLTSILPRQATREPESNPVARRPVNPPPAPARPSIDTTASEPATCHHCRQKFRRPLGSQRGVCPDCHEDGHR